VRFQKIGEACCKAASRSTLYRGIWFVAAGALRAEACELVGLQRCTYSYQSRHEDDVLMRERLKQLARDHPRWGYRFLCVLLRRGGHKINHKRVLRLYREKGLKLRPKKRRKVVSVQRVTPQATTGINQRWSMDFVNDILNCGQRFRLLTLVNCHSRECLALEVDTSLNGQRVVRVLERLKETRGLPAVIQTDNGPEFTGHALDRVPSGGGLSELGKAVGIESGKPIQNAAWLGVSTSTVKYHARHAFRGHTGRWDLNREQAQKVVNRIFHFGHTKVVVNHLKTNPSNSAKSVAQSPL